MRPSRVILLAAFACLAVVRPAPAQDLRFALFDRYLDSLREQTGTPGLSAAIVQSGVLVWERGYGKRDLEAALPALPDTPYRIGGLSQVVGSALVLRMCAEQRDLYVTDRVTRWLPRFPEPATTIGELLAHVAPDGTYRYDPARFAILTQVVEECTNATYPRVVTDEILNRFALIDAIPGAAGAAPLPSGGLPQITPLERARFAANRARAAVSYRLDSRRRPVRSMPPDLPLSTASGLFASVRDLARLDVAFTAGAVLRPETLQAAWTPATAAGGPGPAGLGWFIQAYTAPGRAPEPIVWQFGVEHGASSALLLRLPQRELTLILLANSDALSAPFTLDAGDVMTSLFARLFLRLFAN